MESTRKKKWCATCSTTRRPYGRSLSLKDRRMKKLFNVLWKILRRCWKLWKFEMFYHSTVHQNSVFVQNTIILLSRKKFCKMLNKFFMRQSQKLKHGREGLLVVAHVVHNFFLVSIPYEKVTEVGSSRNPIKHRAKCSWTV